MTNTTTTCPVICPPQSPPVLSMKKGDRIADDMIVVEIGPSNKYALYQCWDCSRGFNHERHAVYVMFDGDDGIFALHDTCAEDYRMRCVPMVVTVHADGTASVTGPGGYTAREREITVVTETPITDPEVDAALAAYRAAAAAYDEANVKLAALVRAAESSSGSYTDADDFRHYQHRDVAIDALSAAQRALAALGHGAKADG